MRSRNHRARIAAANRVSHKNRATQTLAGIILLTMLAGILSGCGNENNPKPPGGKLSREAQLQQHLLHSPSDMQAQLSLANLYYDTNRPHMAIPHYLETLKQQPDNPAIRTDLGTCYKRLGAMAQARAEYERVLKSHPEHVQTIFNLAVITHVEGNYSDAAELWERAAAVAPESPIAQASLLHAADARKKIPQESSQEHSTPASGKEDGTVNE